MLAKSCAFGYCGGMISTIALGLVIPFLGTVLGAACVFFMKRALNDTVRRFLLGFAGGVMTAAAVWSLLLPAMSLTAENGLFPARLTFIPALAGFACGVLFLFILDCITPHLHAGDHTPEGPRSHLSRTAMLVFAVTLHNIPEGMAVGVLFAGLLSGAGTVTVASAFALALGIAIQNFPEGAVVSMPLRTEGNGKLRSFLYGVLSGAVEPLAAVATILLTDAVEIALPYLLSFAAGAMLYVVVEELIPEATRDEKTNSCTIGYAFGFALMMVLDVALG